ncbi:MAG: histidine kinase [Bacteroidota bacterium]
MPESKLFISRKKLFWINIGLWVLMGLLAFLRQLFYMSRQEKMSDWRLEMIWAFADYLSFALLSFAIYFFFIKTYERPFKTFLLLHLPASICFALVHLILSILATMIGTRMIKPAEMEFGEAFVTNLSNFIGFSINGVIIYWLIVGGLFALSFYARYKNQQILSLDLESKLNQSQLQTLKMQLQPHFLFNALNTIAMMVRNEKDKKAVEMISGLSDLLRESLAREGAQMVRLEEEIQLLEKYLKIEETRFQDRLEVNMEIDADTRALAFPSLLLQPILENAFKHGISQSLDQAILRIKTELQDKKLHVWIDNTGPTLAEDWELDKQRGIGLSNTRNRLQQLYGEDFSFSVFNLSLSGVSVHIIIPAHRFTSSDIG